MKLSHFFRVCAMLAFATGCLGMTGCASVAPSELRGAARLTPLPPSKHDLLNFPAPKGKLTIAVYGLRDQTGQYKTAPDSSFSTVVTQGTTSILVKALHDSGWFIAVEREGLQNLLTERKIARALETPPPAGSVTPQTPPLLAASLLIEGAIVSYESNVRTGGAGAKFLGIGVSTRYRIDQVGVNLRSVDIRNGQILQSVSTTKTIYSYEISPSVFKFVNTKDLLEFEAGVTRNEPAQLCVSEAIEAAVAHLIAQGLKDGNWALKDPAQWRNPVLQRYLRDYDHLYLREKISEGKPHKAEANEDELSGINAVRQP